MLSGPSQQLPEERAEGSGTSQRRKKITISSPVFAALLLVLAIAVVFAWLALSSEKPPSEIAKNPGVTVIIKFPGDELKPIDVSPTQLEELVEAEPNSVETEAAGPAEAEIIETAVLEDAEKAKEASRENKPEDSEVATSNITLVAPAVAVNEIIPLALPDLALLQETKQGALPIIGPDGREPWKVYGRKVPPVGDFPRLAVIVSGLGLSADATERAINLPKEVTLSFTPYGPQLDTEVAAARQAGHEVLLDLPMEPVSYPADDPGPHTLLTSLNPNENIARLDWLLGRFKAYVGVINQMGSRFTTSPESLRPILLALKDRGLMFVDSRSSSKSVAAGLARQMNLPNASNDRFIDHEPFREAIDQSLAAAEGEARAQGAALVVARPFPITLERMAEWLPKLKSRGIEIVPVTAMANKKGYR